MMTIKQVLNENPEITNELREFFKSKLLDSIKESNKLPKAFTDALVSEGVSVALLENYLTSTPRLICDFMDMKDVLILPIYSQDAFSFTINGNLSLKMYDTRKDAEYDSVIDSINFYKEKLNESSE